MYRIEYILVDLKRQPKQDNRYECRKIDPKNIEGDLLDIHETARRDTAVDGYQIFRTGFPSATSAWVYFGERVQLPKPGDPCPEGMGEVHLRLLKQEAGRWGAVSLVHTRNGGWFVLKDSMYVFDPETGQPAEPKSIRSMHPALLPG